MQSVHVLTGLQWWVIVMVIPFFFSAGFILGCIINSEELLLPVHQRKQWHKSWEPYAFGISVALLVFIWPLMGLVYVSGIFCGYDFNSPDKPRK